VPYAAGIAAAKGWSSVFEVFIVCNLIAAGLALFVLKPMRQRHFAATRQQVGGGERAASVA